MSDTTHSGRGRGRGRGRGVSMARIPSSASDTTSTSSATFASPVVPPSTMAGSSAVRPAPLLRSQSVPQYSSSPLAVAVSLPGSPTTATTAAGNVFHYQPGHPQYPTYLAALHYYMNQYNVASPNGNTATLPGASPSSTPGGTPVASPQNPSDFQRQASISSTVPGLEHAAGSIMTGAASTQHNRQTPNTARNMHSSIISSLSANLQAASSRPPMLPGAAGLSTRPTMPPVDPSTLPILTKDRIRHMVAQVDPLQRLENDVEEMMLEIANDFIARVTEKACKLARHRGSDSVGVRDARIPLEQDWGIRVPGFGADARDRDDREEPSGEKDTLTDTEKTRQHIARMQKVREAIRDAGRGKHMHNGAGGVKKIVGKGKDKAKEKRRS
ncbi:hypothetical protein SpCBS45565_g04281 [Spizellomyces sp. 'palustris']|nr:hypothetical protein SpCBS45565_g04281 [Spizellomyces sp. 'palustris']